MQNRTWNSSAGRQSSFRLLLDHAVKTKGTHVGEEWQALVAHPAIDIVIECTGVPVAAIEHALGAFENGKHVINVTVEADSFCGQ